MTTDALKEYIIGSKKLFPDNRGERHSRAIKEYGRYLSLLKKESKHMKEDPVEKADAERSEILSSLHMMEEAYASAVKDGAPGRRALFIARRVLSEYSSLFTEEKTADEALRVIYEVCCMDEFFNEDDLISVVNSLRLEYIRLAALTVTSKVKRLGCSAYTTTPSFSPTGTLSAFFPFTETTSPNVIL